MYRQVDREKLVWTKRNTVDTSAVRKIGGKQGRETDKAFGQNDRQIRQVETDPQGD